MGGQTALNCALDLAREGVLQAYGVEMIGASREAIDKAEDREKFKAGHDPHRAGQPALVAGSQHGRGAAGAGGARGSLP